MSENPPPNSTVSHPIDHRAERRARRAERRAARYGGSGAWLIGAALIVFGVIFLLQNMGALQMNNWWALFILLPAFGSFGTAYSVYRNNDGRLTAAGRGALISGLVLTAIAAFFLFNLDCGKLWPLLLILAGIGALVNALLPD